MLELKKSAGATSVSAGVITDKPQNRDNPYKKTLNQFAILPYRSQSAGDSSPLGYISQDEQVRRISSEVHKKPERIYGTNNLRDFKECCQELYSGNSFYQVSKLILGLAQVLAFNPNRCDNSEIRSYQRVSKSIGKLLLSSLDNEIAAQAKKFQESIGPRPGYNLSIESSAYTCPEKLTALSSLINQFLAPDLASALEAMGKIELSLKSYLKRIKAQQGKFELGFTKREKQIEELKADLSNKPKDSFLGSITKSATSFLRKKISAFFDR
jgi:hypothetical protein